MSLIREAVTNECFHHFSNNLVNDFFGGKMLLKALKSESLQSWHKTPGSPGHLCVIRTNQKGPNPSLMSEKSWEVVEILFSVKMCDTFGQETSYSWGTIVAWMGTKLSTA